MTAVFVDGFDSYSGTGAPVGLASKWAVTATPTLPAGRFGGQAVRVTNSNTNVIKSPTFTAVSSFTIGMGVKPESFDTDPVIGLYSGTTLMIALRFSTDGSLGVYRGATLLGSSAAATFVVDTWYTLEVEVVIDDSAGRVTAYVDNSQVLNLTSVDTRNGTPTTVDNMWFGNLGSSVGQTNIDDLYILDSATRPTKALRVETAPVASDGATLNFTPSTGSDHYAVADEMPASAADYLQGSTVGELDELGITALSTTPDAIEAVQVVGYLQTTDATARSMALEVKSGATTSTGSNYTVTSAGQRRERILATDPDTSSAWTASGVNALLLRPKVTV